jgi:hypothetical protein
MKPLSLLLLFLLAPALAGCGEHLSDQEKTEWVDYWTQACRCQAPGVDRSVCMAKVRKPDERLPYGKYASQDQEIIHTRGIRCERGTPR